jgi:hypothetical protein
VIANPPVSLDAVNGTATEVVLTLTAVPIVGAPGTVATNGQAELARNCKTSVIDHLPDAVLFLVPAVEIVVTVIMLPLYLGIKTCPHKK